MKVLFNIREKKHRYYVQSIIDSLREPVILETPDDCLKRSDGWVKILRSTRSLLSYRHLLLTLDGYFVDRYIKYLSKPFQYLPKWVIELKATDKLCRFIDYLAGVDENIIKQIKFYDTDIVMIVAGGIKTGAFDIDYLKAAKKLGIKTAVLAMSWDSLSIKALVQEAPDVLLVWNKVHVRE